MTKARDLADLIAAGNPLSDGVISYAEVTGTPTLATVATSGAYADVTGTPTIPTDFVSAASGGTFTGDVSFGDNDKAIFGAGNDLQIYSDGSNSVIHETDGTGNLIVKASNINLQNSGGTATLAQFIDGGKSSLRYNSVEKLATTATGVDITGELVAESYNETYAALSGTSPAVNCHNGNSFSLVLSGNSTFTFTNPPASGTAYSFSIEIIQDSGASGYAVTWPSSVDWPSATAPTLTATANAKDIFVFTTRDGGTNWYGFTAGQALG